MTGVLALSGIAIVSLVAAAAISVAFVGGLIWLSVRGRRAPDIPPAMKPGPSDEVLERRKVESVPGWSALFVLFFAVWLPLYWLREPTVNVADELRAKEISAERGSRWFQISSEENPTGFGCARCHGAEAQGGTTPYEGETYPVPALVDVCGRLTIEGPGQIRETIMQGREGTPMPSWSIRFEGPMNDQQIQDLINYLVSIQKVPRGEDRCRDPKLASPAAEPSPGPTASPTEEPAVPSPRPPPTPPPTATPEAA